MKYYTGIIIIMIMIIMIILVTTFIITICHFKYRCCSIEAVYLIVKLLMPIVHGFEPYFPGSMDL